VTLTEAPALIEDADKRLRALVDTCALTVDAGSGARPRSPLAKPMRRDEGCVRGLRSWERSPAPIRPHCCDRAGQGKCRDGAIFEWGGRTVPSPHAAASRQNQGIFEDKARNLHKQPCD
jgi:hypothetical protein